MLRASLVQRDWAVWYDNTMENLTAEGMKEGVRNSAVFVLFMTKGVFTRPFVRIEIEEALKERKPIILLHETDDRHGKFDFDTETNVPEDFRPKARQLLSDNESLGWARRDYAQEAVLNQIKRRFYRSLKSGGAGGGAGGGGKEMRKEQ